MRAEGVSDYLIQPLQFTNGEVHAISWTTQRPGGFTDDDVAALEAIRRPLARLAEVYGLRRLATTLLDTYVGRDAGERILQGQIRRGDVERIDAVILLSDLRDFTAQSDRLPGEAVIGLLNSYFDCLVPALQAHGGEVLKFVGDGLLGDPAGRGRSGGRLPQRACRRGRGEDGSGAGQRRARRAGRAEVALRRGAAPRRGAVRQHRQHRPARLHHDRPGGQPDRAARDARARSRPRARGFRRVRAALPRMP